MKVKVELEQEQWSWVLDAISESESKAQQYEEMWEGRCREKQYRDEKRLSQNSTMILINNLMNLRNYESM